MLGDELNSRFLQTGPFLGYSWIDGPGPAGPGRVG